MAERPFPHIRQPSRSKPNKKDRLTACPKDQFTLFATNENGRAYCQYTLQRNGCTIELKFVKIRERFDTVCVLKNQTKMQLYRYIPKISFKNGCL